ncbi:MAG: (2Fe-2S)-binding protein [Acidobacteriota bacterium]|nr:(2Fe-2S)-binding protein [Acidobacteriota bacterium]
MALIRIDGRAAHVADGITVAAALLSIDQMAFRRSVSGEPRAPLCGIGICFECRVTIDGVAHARSCQIAVREGMEIVTA